MGIGPSALDKDYVLDKIFKDCSHMDTQISKELRVRLDFQCLPSTGQNTCESQGLLNLPGRVHSLDQLRDPQVVSGVEAVLQLRWGGQFNVGGYDDSWGSQFPTIKVMFNSVETEWVPQAYFYRKGKTDTYCYGFEDDGPRANTVLGAVWMMHKDRAQVPSTKNAHPISRHRALSHRQPRLPRLPPLQRARLPRPPRPPRPPQPPRPPRPPRPPQPPQPPLRQLKA
eukprot:Skav211382  [mRNA]  locus=scaffold2406:181827:184479:- [translate_table: standard]